MSLSFELLGKILQVIGTLISIAGLLGQERLETLDKQVKKSVTFFASIISLKPIIKFFQKLITYLKTVIYPAIKSAWLLLAIILAFFIALLINPISLFGMSFASDFKLVQPFWILAEAIAGILFGFKLLGLVILIFANILVFPILGLIKIKITPDLKKSVNLFLNDGFSMLVVVAILSLLLTIAIFAPVILTWLIIVVLSVLTLLIASIASIIIKVLVSPYYMLEFVNTKLKLQSTLLLSGIVLTIIGTVIA
jgi:hypothetical protein